MQLTDAQPTAFEIVGIGVVPLSARGITAEYRPIENGEISYDVWGVAHTTARTAFNLFEVTVKCEDLFPPGFVGLWRGQAVTIHGTDDFIEPASIAQQRPDADGVVYLDAAMIPLPSAPGAVWRRYRPVMQVLVEDWRFSGDEWEAKTSWSISFKETH